MSYITYTAHQTLLFYHPSMSSIAEYIAKNDDKITLGTLKKKDTTETNWPVFADGWPNLFIENLHGVKVCDCVFLASFDSPANIFEQLAVIYSLVHNRARNMKVIIPWFPTGTMERVSDPGEIATASTMARLLSAIPLGVTGTTVVSFLDIHALQEQFYFGDNLAIELKTGMGLLYTNPDVKLTTTDIIAFPDEGAYKRYKRMFKNHQVVVCEKRRIIDANQNAIKIVVIKDKPDIGTAKRIFIVDDMIQTGGTMIKCADAIRQNYGDQIQINMFATHGVFPETTIETGSDIADVYRRQNPENNGKWPSWYCFLASPHVHCVYVTNSIPKNKDNEAKAQTIMSLVKKGVQTDGVQVKFRCLNIAPVVTSIIKNTDVKEYDS